MAPDLVEFTTSVAIPEPSRATNATVSELSSTPEIPVEPTATATGPIALSAPAPSSDPVDPDPLEPMDPATESPAHEFPPRTSFAHGPSNAGDLRNQVTGPSHESHKHHKPYEPCEPHKPCTPHESLPSHHAEPGISEEITCVSTYDPSIVDPDPVDVKPPDKPDLMPLPRPAEFVSLNLPDLALEDPPGFSDPTLPVKPPDLSEPIDIKLSNVPLKLPVCKGSTHRRGTAC